jgi:hypothetical protein
MDLNTRTVRLPNQHDLMKFQALGVDNQNPKEFKDFVETFKKNCEYMKKNFKRYPTADLCSVQEKNIDLLLEMQHLFLP